MLEITPALSGKPERMMNDRQAGKDQKNGWLDTLKRLVMRLPKPEEDTLPIEVEKKDEWISELSVYLTNGDVTGVKFHGKEAGVYPWRHFYKWWFSRKGSDSYIFRYEGGETMVRRDLIKSFELKRNDK